MVTVTNEVEPDESVVPSVASAETTTDNGSAGRTSLSSLAKFGNIYPTLSSSSGAQWVCYYSQVETNFAKGIRVGKADATMLIAPEAAAAMEAELRCWMQRSPSPVKGKLYRYSYSEEKYLRRMPAQRNANCLRFYRDLFVNDNSAGRRQILDELLEVRRLPPDYPIAKLRGQRGVFARTDIPTDTVLGLYAGIILRHGTKEAESRDFQSELLYLNRLDQGAFLTARDIHRYAFDLPLCPQNESQGGDRSFTASALGRGNCLCLVNGYREVDGLPAWRLNATTVTVRMDANVPVVLFLTSRDIAKDEEILIDYGDSYFWPLEVEQMPTNIDRPNIREVSGVRPFNRFTRTANNASEEFVLHVASIGQLHTVSRDLTDDGVAFRCENNTLRIDSRVMAAAISKQARTPPVLFKDMSDSPLVITSEAISPVGRKIERTVEANNVKTVSATRRIPLIHISDVPALAAASPGDAGEKLLILCSRRPVANPSGLIPVVRTVATRKSIVSTKGPSPTKSRAIIPSVASLTVGVAQMELKQRDRAESNSVRTDRIQWAAYRKEYCQGIIDYISALRSCKPTAGAALIPVLPACPANVFGRIATRSTRETGCRMHNLESKGFIPVNILNFLNLAIDHITNKEKGVLAAEGKRGIHCWTVIAPQLYEQHRSWHYEDLQNTEGLRLLDMYKKMFLDAQNE